MSTLTCSVTSKAWKSSGERTTESGTTTTRPPCNSAPQVSQTDDVERHRNDTAPTPPPPADHASNDASNWVTLWWVMATPLGVPVVPEV